MPAQTARPRASGALKVVTGEVGRPAIELRGVTKRFRRQTVRGGYTTFKTQLVKWFSGQRDQRAPAEHIEVLKGVDLVVPAGKTVGIIGENGSGKSTLLKILTGIYSPTAGKVEVRGRISALLELGAGFHPDFSGRENIFVNGIILGLSRAELKAKLNDIIEFSELGEFIDQPVRNYSSGMYMRLAFSVATFVDPDVLIIDEILAVGDEHFSRKCRTRMDEFKAQGKTIVLVTHDAGTVERWCDLAGWLQDGRVREWGDPKRVVAQYRQYVAEKEMSAATPGPPEAPQTSASPSLAVVPQEPVAEERSSERPGHERWGNGAVLIRRVRMLGDGGVEGWVWQPGARVEIEIEYEARVSTLEDVGFGIGIFRDDGVQAFGTNTFIDQAEGLPRPLPDRGAVHVLVERLSLGEGNYKLDVAVHSKEGLAYDYHRAMHAFAVRAPVAEVGLASLPRRWEFTSDERAAEAVTGSGDRGF